MTASHDNNATIVYWHRDLLPLDAELVAEHTVEASSSRVPGTLAHRDELWDQCYQELMTNTTKRLVEEVTRLGGHYAHVHDEAISPKHDDAAGEAWMHGRFTYMLYRRPAGRGRPPGRARWHVRQPFRRSRGSGSQVACRSVQRPSANSLLQLSHSREPRRTSANIATI